MTSKISQIRIQGTLVGLAGLEDAFQVVAQLGLTAPEVLQEELLTRLGRQNYIPREAREAYKAALWREFRRFRGEEPAPEAADRLEVVVLGAGCFGCQQLYRQVIELLAQKHVLADVQYITNPVQLQDYPVKNLPALLVNGRVALAGRLPAPAELEDLLLKGAVEQAQTSTVPEGTCPCT